MRWETDLTGKGFISVLMGRINKFVDKFTGGVGSREGTGGIGFIVYIGRFNEREEGKNKKDVLL